MNLRFQTPGHAITHRRPDWERAGLQEARVIPMSHEPVSTPVVVRSEPVPVFDDPFFYVLRGEQGWKFVFKWHRAETNEITPVSLPDHVNSWEIIVRELCRALWEAESANSRRVYPYWHQRVTVDSLEYWITRPTWSRYVISRLEGFRDGLPVFTTQLRNDELCRLSHKLVDMWVWRHSNDAA